MPVVAPFWFLRPFLHNVFVQEVTHQREAGARTRSEEKRDFSLRRPTHSQERMRKKKSACFVRNDGGGTGRMRKKKSACFVRNDGAGSGRDEEGVRGSGRGRSIR